MTSQQRIITNEEADQGFGLLKEIVDMVKNPKSIEDAYSRRRKAAELTDTELEKSNKARDFIAKYDALLDELKQREDALELAKNEHNNAVIALKEKTDGLNTTLATRSSELDVISAHQNNVSDALALDRKRLTEEMEKLRISIEARAISLNIREKAIVDGEAANAKELTRLSGLEEKLKAKASRLAAEASDW